MKQVKCQRSGYENRTQARPGKKTRIKKSEMNKTQTTRRVQKGKGEHTHSRRTDNCCTDEATRRRGIYRHKDGGEGERKQREIPDTAVRTINRNKKEERREKKKEEKIVLQAVTVTWVPVSARNPIREPSHTLFRLLPTLVNGGVRRVSVLPPSRPSPLNNSTRSSINCYKYFSRYESYFAGDCCITNPMDMVFGAAAR